MSVVVFVVVGGIVSLSSSTVPYFGTNNWLRGGIHNLEVSEFPFLDFDFINSLWRGIQIGWSPFFPL